MLAPFIFGTAEPTDPQYGQLTHPRRQCRLGQYVSSEHHPTSSQIGVIGESSKYSEDFAVGASHSIKQLLLGLVGLIIRNWWHTWNIESHDWR